MASGEIVGFVLLPDGFSRDLAQGVQTEILLGADGSNMGVGASALAAGSEFWGYLGKSVVITNAVGTGSTMAALSPLSFVLKPIYNPANNFRFFLLIGLAAAFWQHALICAAAPSVVSEWAEGTWQGLAAKDAWGFKALSGKMLAYSLPALSDWLGCTVILFGYSAFISCLCVGLGHSGGLCPRLSLGRLPR